MSCHYCLSKFTELYDIFFLEGWKFLYKNNKGGCFYGGEGFTFT